MVEITAMTYEQVRSKYFEEQMQKAQRRMKYWEARIDRTRPDNLMDEAHGKAADAGWEYNFYKDALEALAAQPKWISVNERLPEAYDDGSVDAVLVTDGYFIHMAYFSGGKWRFCESGEMKEEMFYSVTHWMLLLEPPRRTFSRSLASKHDNDPVRKDG